MWKSLTMGIKMVYTNDFRDMRKGLIPTKIFVFKGAIFNRINTVKKCRKRALKNAKTPLIFVDLPD